MCEIGDSMQVVYKELTYDRVKFKVTKSKFDSSKTSKHGIIAGKQWHLVPCEIFSVVG